MNLSIAIALVNTSVRAVRVVYDPDVFKNNNPNRLFKTLDPDLAKDDFVIVPTHTRHGFTVAKVEEVGFRIDFNAPDQWAWIAGKVDKPAYDLLISQEKTVLDRIGGAEENRMRKELSESLGLGEINFTDLDVVKGSVAPKLASPRGTAQAAFTPTPDEPRNRSAPTHAVTGDDIPF